ncbi:GNAT family N-acetyltransferase [Pseudomonas sp. HMWF032]|uniref:GNAT family N-acetyltransferase n=1 Tax=Pseudomonas sp. HMWF032 TaxID=2056866 RepID=UPI000D3A5E48|nr:GNAT family N-acetyltransferase [Pseudomonas sp. HMWF032]PTS84402.1 GNAT family N-acetyltransferase [Pseudomonas sp. HMWF032]PTT85561.1 GNAT family N-acetyltransferase [Pseudomonas sp. HMWF010]
MNSNKLTRLPLPDGRQLSARDDGASLALHLDEHALLRAQRQGELLVPLELALAEQAEALWLLAYWCFANEPQRQSLVLRLEQVDPALLNSGLLVVAGDELCIERARFWQLTGPFLRNVSHAGYPQQMIMHASGRRHPRRGPKPVGEVYRRFDANLGAWISLRTLDIDEDLARFNRWQNSARVAAFWQEEGDLDKHRRYLQELLDDPRVLPLIGCFDDQPFAYYEAYWAKEDRIAPFYAVDDYDRGIHMLVGEENHRGPHKVASWLNALTHYLLLDEPRTQRIVAEPRADNAKMIGHMQAQGYHKDKEFHFPHKRAALMIQSREVFFERCNLA